MRSGPMLRPTDFRTMPLEATPEAHKALETWGDDALDWLTGNVLTHYSPTSTRTHSRQRRCAHGSSCVSTRASGCSSTT